MLCVGVAPKVCVYGFTATAERQRSDETSVVAEELLFGLVWKRAGSTGEMLWSGWVVS